MRHFFHVVRQSFSSIDSKQEMFMVLQVKRDRYTSFISMHGLMLPQLTCTIADIHVLVVEKGNTLPLQSLKYRITLSYLLVCK